MKLSLATNWDPALLEQAKNYPVHDVFGAVPVSIMGSGRPSFILPQINKTQAKEYVSLAHSLGIEFTYLLNAPCLGNLEYDKDFHHELLKYLEWIAEIGVDCVTVAIPYLVEIIKNQFPNLQVKVSVIANVNTVPRLKFFENLGADVITLDYMINRDFKLLERMVDAADCTLELLANDLCLYQCPYRQYHYSLAGHASQNSNRLKGFYIDYCLMHCTKDFLSTPGELLKARWIRPEDISAYEALGIDYFKLSDRCKSTEWLVNTVRAYATRDYSGNLLDILNDPQPSIEKEVHAPQYLQDIARPEHFEKQEFVNLFRLEKGEPIKPYIDNKSLEGFIDFFKTEQCNGNCGYGCDYCETWVERAVVADQDTIGPYLSKLDEVLENLSTSTFFS
jgi:collagenase-like PrtC family protease